MAPMNAVALGAVDFRGVTSALCYHCRETMPAGANFQVVTPAGREPVCCAGCQAVAQAILSNGLGDYYRHRQRPAERVVAMDSNSQNELSRYDDPEVQRSFARRIDSTTFEAALMLDGIRCAACVWLNEQQLGRMPGVLSVSVNYTTQRALVRWDDRIVHMSEILRSIAQIGYRAFPYDAQVREQLTRHDRKQRTRRLFIAGIGMMQVMMYAVPAYLAHGDMTADIEQLMRVASLFLTLPVVVYSAQPFFVGAWRELKNRRLAMDTPVALGISAASAASLIATLIDRGAVYFDSVTMFVFFLLMGRYLEGNARQRAADKLENITRSLPAIATRLPNYPSARAEEQISVAALVPTDHVLIRPGEIIPADGIVLEGLSEVNESLLTGESIPIPKQIGATLIGGAVNISNPMIMRVERVGHDTSVSTMALLAERAVSERPRISRVADKVANQFVAALLVLAIAVGTLWLWMAPDKALAAVISLLVVSCPCALSLAAPSALVTSAARLLHGGLLVTRPNAIETLATASHFVFDKTGTLTHGNMQLTTITPLSGLSAERCLEIAQALQFGSEHPIGRAIRAAPTVESRELEVAKGANIPGRGIEGEIDGAIYRIGNADFVTEILAQPNFAHCKSDDTITAVVLGNAQGLLARLVLQDTLRQDAKPLVEALHKLGRQVILLSGDGTGSVRDVAERLGIEHWFARMTPIRKLEFVRSLQREGAIVAMVGDGINDAPVLAGADVSVAVGTSAELAKIHADVVMLSPRLLALYRGILTARHGLRIIKQNLAWAFAYNFTAIPLAAFGLVPWMPLRSITRNSWSLIAVMSPMLVPAASSL